MKKPPHPFRYHDDGIDGYWTVLGNFVYETESPSGVTRSFPRKWQARAWHAGWTTTSGLGAAEPIQKKKSRLAPKSPAPMAQQSDPMPSMGLVIDTLRKS
jgi:hypothetical protein